MVFFSGALVEAPAVDLRIASWRVGPRCHDAAGGMESLAGGACALGEVGWTFRSVVSYNVTKCDMRRSMCRSDVSVDRSAVKDHGDIPRRAHNFGRRCLRQPSN